MAELMTAAASGVVQRRREAVTGAGREREAEHLPAIADYTDRAHQGVLATHDSIQHRYPKPRQGPDAYHFAPTPPHSSAPKRRQVVRGLAAAVEALSATVDTARDVLNQAARDEPYVPATAEFAATVHGRLLAACGQLSIAHRAYQRAIHQPRKPFGRNDFHLQTAGLVHGLRERIPDQAWQILDGCLRGGEYVMALEDLAATLIAHTIEMTNVEYGTMVSLLRHRDPPGRRPSTADQIEIPRSLAPATVSLSRSSCSSCRRTWTPGGIGGG